MLAGMLSVDRDALICDMAETYHIYDFNAVPVVLLATLCAGLREDSRIKMRINGLSEIPTTYTLVHIADSFSILLKALSGDKKKPALYFDMLTGKRKVEHKGGFESIEDFETARQRFLDG